MELSTLLKEAEAASPMTRIEWRDQIAEHGADAIEAVRPWLESPALAAFAVRVIERAATNGHAALATQVLRSARPRVPERDRGDVDWALQRLRARSQEGVEVARPPESGPVAAARLVKRQRTTPAAAPRPRAR